MRTFLFSHDENSFSWIFSSFIFELYLIIHFALYIFKIKFRKHLLAEITEILFVITASHIPSEHNISFHKSQNQMLTSRVMTSTLPNKGH